MSFVVFAWIGLIAFGLVIIVSKLTSKHSIFNPWLFNFSWTLLSLIFTLPLAIMNKAGLPNEWFFIVIAAFFNALWFILYAFTLYRLDVSVLSPLYNFRTVFAVILSAIFLGEIINPNQYIYFILILVGGIFSSLDEKFNIKSFFDNSVLLGILSMLSLALNNVVVKKVLQLNDFWDGTLWMLIFTQLFLLFTYPLFKKDLQKIKKRQIYPVIVIALLAVVGNISLNIAYKEKVGITSLIVAIPASMIFAFLFSVFAPKLLEKHTLKVYIVRFSAAAVMIISALKLSV